MRYLLLMLIVVSETTSAQTEFTFRSLRQRVRTTDSHDTCNFLLKTGRNADTLFFNDTSIIGTIAEHGEVNNDNGKTEFYFLYTALLDSTRMRIPSNYNLDLQFIFYCDRSEKKVLSILEKSFKHGMMWYYKK